MEHDVPTMLSRDTGMTEYADSVIGEDEFLRKANIEIEVEDIEYVKLDSPSDFVYRVQTAIKNVVKEEGYDSSVNVSLRNLKELIGEDLRPHLIKPVLIWLLWMSIGSIYYAWADAFSAAKGFYYAVSIGYSIGYGVLHEPNDFSKIFSVTFNLFGVLIVGAYLSLILKWSFDAKADWRLNALRSIQESKTVLEVVNPDIFSEDTLTTVYKLQRSIYLWLRKLPALCDKHFLVFCTYICFGTFWSLGVIKWVGQISNIYNTYHSPNIKYA